MSLNARTLALGALVAVLSTHALHGQDRSRYRNFPLGGNLSSISALTGVAASEAKTIHLRPAMMQELQWQRPYFVGGAAAAAPIDPVRGIRFSFYNDQLSRMVVDYDRDRTAGMTDADMIDALTAEYGPPLKAPVRNARTNQAEATPLDQESGMPVARWGDADYSVVLYRASYGPGFQMTVTSPRLDALARTADAEATRLDEREAPAREIARQKKETDDALASQEKARLANKAAFRP